MRLKVGLLGGGSWGTTVASVVSRNAPITLWARDAETVEDINASRENRKYLPGIRLPSALRATGDMAEAVAGADVLVMGVPSHSFRGVLEEARAHLRPWVP
ncbi:MAG TPA: NAD(P)-binding domain-containing protein, partial [Sphingopyxis sp.]|nr:NAD(P)-binding domain-containing protein [Sphingopyxis sp.]